MTFREWWDSDAPAFVLFVGLMFAWECYVKGGLLVALLGYIGWFIGWFCLALFLD